MNKLITILSFSARNNGNCANIRNEISKYYKNDVCSFEINEDTIHPCGKCDYQCLRSGMSCPKLDEAYLEIMDTICNSRLVYFVVPNYCGYPCANYYAFNERSVGYFGTDRQKLNRYLEVPKRFIIVSNTEGFEDAMRQQTNSQPDILYLKSRKYQRQSIAGDILDCDDARKDLMQFLDQSLAQSV